MKRTKAKTSSHHHSYHVKRLTLYAVLLFSLFAVRLDADNKLTLTAQSANAQDKVLAYAIEMSRGALLAGTNSARASNGLGPLTENSLLNSSAQAKAQDLVNNDYWAHVSPTGTQPWYFFQQAGYVYIRAGENLAYGFGSSQGTIDGWMNSPTHRDNILGNYAEVGFGIVNAENYQSSGPQTVVVAHYGSRQSSPTPPPAVTAPAPTVPAVQPKSDIRPSIPTAEPTETPSTPEPTTVQPTKEPAKPKETTPSTANNESPPAVVSTGNLSSLPLLQNLMSNKAGTTALLAVTASLIAVTGLALTHRSAFRNAVLAGENYALSHPSADTAIVGSILLLMFLTTYGYVG